MLNETLKFLTVLQSNIIRPNTVTLTVNAEGDGLVLDVKWLNRGQSLSRALKVNLSRETLSSFTDDSVISDWLIEQINEQISIIEGYL